MSLSNKISRKLLITQSDLHNYAGSEIVTLEIAEHAISVGFQVAVLTNYFSSPISHDFPEQVKVYGPDESLDIYEFSHIWIHHNLIPKSLIEALLKSDGTKPLPIIAFHHMSPHIPIESPLFPVIEKEVASFIYFNSEESRDAHSDVIGIKKTKVLGNPAPDSFMRHATLSGGNLEKILVVTNHAPDEINEGIKILKSKGVAVDHFGHGGIPVRIKPDIIQSYDLIISIGKTIQYSLLAGVPVYCYDHFGGPGYLKERNFAKARYFNFSGRGFSKKEGKKIADDIINNYSSAVTEFSKLHRLHKKEFILSEALGPFLNSRSTNNPQKIISKEILIPTSKLLEINHNLTRTSTHYRLERDDIEAKFSELSKSYISLNKELDELRSYVQGLPHNRIKNSIQRRRKNRGTTNK